MWFSKTRTASAVRRVPTASVLSVHEVFAAPAADPALRSQRTPQTAVSRLRQARKTANTFVHRGSGIDRRRNHNFIEHENDNSFSLCRPMDVRTKYSGSFAFSEQFPPSCVIRRRSRENRCREVRRLRYQYIEILQKRQQSSCRNQSSN